MDISISPINYMPSRIEPQSTPSQAEALKTTPSKSVIDFTGMDPVASQNKRSTNASTNDPTSSATSPETSSSSSSELTQEQRVAQVLSQLKARDTEVRAHEAAHVAAGGAYVTSGASYSYQTGPDGKRYAIGGEVGIDISPVSGDPEATIQKAQQVQRAAMAPASPSSQDYRVAAQAMQMVVQAQAELATTKGDGATESGAEVDRTEGDENETAAKSIRPNSSENQEVGGIEVSQNQPDLVAARQGFELRQISQAWS